MIIYSTFFHHIERGGFRPELTVCNWNSCDRRIVFVCSQEDMDVLKTRNVEAEYMMLSGGIAVPSDVPKRMNETISVCLDTLGADQVALIMGDQYLTERGDNFIKSSIDKDPNVVGYLPSMHVHLYTNQWIHPSEIAISSKARRMVHQEAADGDELVGSFPQLTNDTTLALDMGYISTEAYYKHIRNHAAIWKKPDPYYDFKIEWMRLYDRGYLADAIRRTYRINASIMRKIPDPIDLDVYRELISLLNAWGDYKLCMDVLKDFQQHHSPF